MTQENIMRLAVLAIFAAACFFEAPCTPEATYDACLDDCDSTNEACSNDCTTEACIWSCYDEAVSCLDDCDAELAPICD